MASRPQAATANDMPQGRPTETASHPFLPLHSFTPEPRRYSGQQQHSSVQAQWLYNDLATRWRGCVRSGKHLRPRVGVDENQVPLDQCVNPETDRRSRRGSRVLLLRSSAQQTTL